MDNIKKNNNNNNKNKTKNIGILDPEGKYKNPLTNQPYSEDYLQLAQVWSKFPVYKDARKIIQKIRDNQVLLIIAGTGSGKTVVVPKLALHVLDYEGKVVVTIPKKAPVRSGAEFAAKTLDVDLGEEVGFQFRGARLANNRRAKSERTKLLFSTDGSVVAQLVNDPELKSYDIVIVDEAHERKIQIDLLLLLMKKALKMNPKLKLIIMSATINPEIFANYFKKDFKYDQVEIPGVNYPVEVEYLKTPLKNPETEFIDEGVKRIIQILSNTDSGDILLFVNSLSEAIKTCNKLREEVMKAKLNKVFCVEYTSGISREMEQLAKNVSLYKSLPNGPYDRKVIIATNAVESSLTVDGLIYVIDSGWEYLESYDPKRMMRNLLQSRISKAQANQRKGRVGRTQPGICYRLYTEKEFEEFKDFPITDIKRSDLTNDLLRFMKLPYVKNIGDLMKFLKELIESPDPEYVKSGLYRLFALNAIDKMSEDGKLTEYGEKMVKFRKLDPPLAKMVIESHYYRAEYEAIILSALLIRADGKMDTYLLKFKPDKRKSEREVKKERANYEKVIKKFTHANGDFYTLLKMYMMFKKYEEGHSDSETRRWCEKNYLKYDNLKGINSLVRNIRQETQEILFPREKFDYSVIYEYEEDEKKSAADRRFRGGAVPTISATASAADLMASIMEGLYLNLAVKKGDKDYINCFPPEKTKTILSKDSTIKATKDSKYVVYWELANILGKTKFNLINKVPASNLKALRDRQKRFISGCL